MSNWIPASALFGLIALMIIPAPGIWGVIIGGTCSLAIIFSAVVWLLDRITTRFQGWRDKKRSKRRGRRHLAVHSGAGIARKV